MSIESMAACLHHSKSTGTDKVVLLGIANHDGDGGAYPSIATLAKYANVSERTVQNSINKLIQLGEVRRHINQGGSASTPRDQRPNRYDVLVRCPADCDGSTQHKKRGEILDNGVNSDTERGEVQRNNGVKPTTNRGETDFTLTVLNHPLEPSNNTSRTYSGEVIDACNLLADLIEANGSKRPKVSDTWLRDMERLHRIDERSWEQINAAIRWAQNDTFWRTNILSPGTLRAKYDRLRLKAQAQQKQSAVTKTINWLTNINWDDQNKELGK